VSEPAPLRLCLGGTDPSIDLPSLKEAVTRIMRAAERVRIDTIRLGKTHEERELACANHRHALDKLKASRRALDIAQGDLREVENGNTIQPSEPKETPCHRP
jgi:hypothetical protein